VSLRPGYNKLRLIRTCSAQITETSQGRFSANYRRLSRAVVSSAPSRIVLAGLGKKAKTRETFWGIFLGYLLLSNINVIDNKELARLICGLSRADVRGLETTSFWVRQR
jgi:hypothetical protein